MITTDEKIDEKTAYDIEGFLRKMRDKQTEFSMSLQEAEKKLRKVLVSSNADSEILRLHQEEVSLFVTKTDNIKLLIDELETQKKLLQVSHKKEQLDKVLQDIQQKYATMFPTDPIVPQKKTKNVLFSQTIPNINPLGQVPTKHEIKITKKRNFQKLNKLLQELFSGIKIKGLGEAIKKRIKNHKRKKFLKKWSKMWETVYEENTDPFNTALELLKIYTLQKPVDPKLLKKEQPEIAIIKEVIKPWLYTNPPEKSLPLLYQSLKDNLGEIPKHDELEALVKIIEERSSLISSPQP